LLDSSEISQWVRAAVAQHVGDALANRPGEQAVDRRRWDGAVAGDVEGDARGIEHIACALQLVGEERCRYPVTIARTSARDSRATDSTSPIASAAASGSLLIKRRATCALSAITERLWPRMS